MNEKNTPEENIEKESNNFTRGEQSAIPPDAIIKEDLTGKGTEKGKEKKEKNIVFMPNYDIAPRTFNKKVVVKGNLAYDPEELQQAVDEYFNIYAGVLVLRDKKGNVLLDKFGSVITHIKPPTVAGLSLYLGFENRSSLYDYMNRENESSHIVKKALTKIEEFAESMLYTGKPVGAIFWLKNHKWSDQHQIEVKNSSFEEFLKLTYGENNTQLPDEERVN